MNGIYKKLIAVAIVVIIISVYLIGVNFIKRIDRVDDIKDAVPTMQTEDVKTEAEEDKKLDAIADKININTATKSELMMLDGIGEKLAERIIARRETVGAFTYVDQLLEIEGIGEAKFNKIKDFVIIE